MTPPATRVRLDANANPPKSLWASKTMWGAVIQAAAPLAGVVGVHLSPDEQDLLAAGAAAIAEVVGLVLTVWGRVTATRPIKRRRSA